MSELPVQQEHGPAARVFEVPVTFDKVVTFNGGTIPAVGGGNVITINGDATPAQTLIAGTGISIVDNGIGGHTINATAPIVAALLSINADTTQAQTLTAGAGISIVDGGGGSHTITNTGVISINGDSSAAQTLAIQAATGLLLTDVGPVHTIAGTTFTAIDIGMVPASGGGVFKFLRADGTWQIPPSSGIFSLNGDSHAVQSLAVNAPLLIADDGLGHHTITAPVFTNLAAGIVPASGGGATNFLRADGTWNAPTSFLFSQTTNQTTTANTLSTILGTGNGSLTLPANFFTPGKGVKLRAIGFVSQADSANVTKRLLTLLNATTLIDENPGAFAFLMTLNLTVEIEVVIICQTGGNAGTVNVLHKFTCLRTATQTPIEFQTTNLGTPVVIDCTIPQALDVQFNNNAAPNGTITFTMATLEAIGT